MKGKILVTGGAGFVGCNLVDALLREGQDVTVFDSLVRKGTEKNLEWLQGEARGGKLTFVKGDVRDAEAVAKVTADVEVIYHLAGQVAVTTSVVEPRNDFEVNALGTLNVLEGARASGKKPAIVFTSTNKVYGECEELEVVEEKTRHAYKNAPNGINETQPLDFHSPYGCSKGAADQYVRDYGRIYDLPTVVFRMSCIYGPRQFGNEDQGWVAHFLIAAALGRPITIYGDGKQVRDILFVEDLVRAFRTAVQKIDVTRGRIYNIGGGASNTLSVWSEFGEILGRLKGEPVPAQLDTWRPGDQKVYVSDIRKAEKEMGWKPQVDKEAGIRRLWDWVLASRALFPAPAPKASA